MICFKKIKEDSKIIFQLDQTQNLNEDFQKWIKKRNHSVIFKSALNCDYNIKVRESVLSKSDEIPDLRGLTNGFILFAFFTYGRLMMDHLM